MNPTPFFSFVRPLAVVAFGGNALLRPEDDGSTALQLERAREAVRKLIPILGKGYESADDWAALCACAIILYNSYLIFRPALSEIMDEQLYDPLITEIRFFAKEVDGVIDTEKCFIRKVGMRYLVDLHLVVKADISVKQGHFIAHNLKDHLQEKLPLIADVFIHVEPDDELK